MTCSPVSNFPSPFALEECIKSGTKGQKATIGREKVLERALRPRGPLTLPHTGPSPHTLLPLTLSSFRAAGAPDLRQSNRWFNLRVHLLVARAAFPLTQSPLNG
uniref:Uncharacterized protein n=1 Tax=Knipowitschia caucasica TaxID=637954 RepID=A0AAV2MCI4_KNICA